MILVKDYLSYIFHILRIYGYNFSVFPGSLGTLFGKFSGSTGGTFGL